jgi:hypothetical protein
MMCQAARDAKVRQKLWRHIKWDCQNGGSILDINWKDTQQRTANIRLDSTESFLG